MLWAVGARYGYDTMKLKASRLAFYHRGHLYMQAEEKQARDDTLAAALGGGKR